MERSGWPDRLQELAARDWSVVDRMYIEALFRYGLAVVASMSEQAERLWEITRPSVWEELSFTPTELERRILVVWNDGVTDFETIRAFDLLMRIFVVLQSWGDQPELYLRPLEYLVEIARLAELDLEVLAGAVTKIMSASPLELNLTTMRVSPRHEETDPAKWPGLALRDEVLIRFDWRLAERRLWGAIFQIAWAVLRDSDRNPYRDSVRHLQAPFFWDTEREWFALQGALAYISERTQKDAARRFMAPNQSILEATESLMIACSELQDHVTGWHFRTVLQHVIGAGMAMGLSQEEVETQIRILIVLV